MHWQHWWSWIWNLNPFFRCSSAGGIQLWIYHHFQPGNSQLLKNFTWFLQWLSLMITREYATLFLLGSCFLLDYSSQNPLQAQLQRRTKAGVMSARERIGDMSVMAPVGGVTPLDGRTRLRRHGRSRIQRFKRGWVWNQFFVLEEYMGSDPQYVGKVGMVCSHQAPFMVTSTWIVGAAVTNTTWKLHFIHT